MTGVPDGQTISRGRSELVARADVTGPPLTALLAGQADGWFADLAVALPPGWALMATGGYARGGLCPGSDIDVVLLHPKKAAPNAVQAVAEALWYPLWDSGVKLSPSVHTPASLLALAAGDLVTATSILAVRVLAGDPGLVNQISEGGLRQWRTRPQRWLARLREATEERWERCGDVSSLLEPDLKDGRGGLRDHDGIGWAVATGLAGVPACLDGGRQDSVVPIDTLIAARCEVHRITSRNGNVLLLQDQDAVADALGLADADALMFGVSSAARSIDWVSGRFWRRVDRIVHGQHRAGRAGTAMPLANPIRGVTVVDGEIDVTPDADFTDQALTFRVADVAARTGTPLSRTGLLTLAAGVADPVGPWTERTRRAFVSVLGAGDAVVATIEALEHHDLFTRFLPEWGPVRSRPQRNAFHVFNVDRHLLRTVANAQRFLRDVSRPDLLLVGALLHDIGKGYPDDHTAVGIELVERIVPRMGFRPEDGDVIRSLVEHHLLLSETATRRDLSDPRTAANVAAAVGDDSRLRLLRALTEADSIATGPAAWSSWKRSLVDALTDAVSEELRGRPAVPETVDNELRFADLLARVRAGESTCTDHDREGESDRVTVAAVDAPGLFAKVAGTLALHRIDVFGAEAWTSTDGIAVEQFQLLVDDADRPSFARGGLVERDLVEAIAGRLDIDARLRSRIGRARRAYRRAVSAAPPVTEVLFSNDASDATTMIDVRVPDAPAVLYQLSAVLAANGVDIRAAKVATLGHEVVDVFYVQRAGDRGDVRRLDPAEHEHLRTALIAAVVRPEGSGGD